MRSPTTITDVTRLGRRRPSRLGRLTPERRRVVALAGLAVVGLAFFGWRQVRKKPDPRKGTISIAYRLVATADDGQPLAGVAVSIKGKVAARTDASGELTLPLRGRLGTVVPLTVTCPDSHAGSPTVPPVVMRPHRAIESTAAAPAPAAPAPATTTAAKAARVPTQTLEASVVCDRGVRRAAVLMRLQVETTTTHRDAKGRVTEKIDVRPLDAEIAVDGTPAARTGDGGLAHLALERPKGTKIELDVTPRSAVLEPFVLPFDIADTDDVYVFERTISQRVATAEAPRKRRRAKKPEKRAVRIKAIQRSDEPFLDL